MRLPGGVGADRRPIGGPEVDVTGYDGLGKYSLNFNQGAESSLSYFLARLSMEDIN